VARKVWQPISATMPAAAARRRIMRQASGWPIGLVESARLLWPRAVRNSQSLRSSAMSAASHAQEMAAHESPRTTKLYDRTKDRLTQDEVERIRL
jgi:hypothetical protein